VNGALKYLKFSTIFFSGMSILDEMVHASHVSLGANFWRLTVSP